MRTIRLDITKFGLSVGDIVNLQLIDSMGNQAMSNSGYTINENISLDTQVFEKELLESDKIYTLSSYKLTLPNKYTFKFRLPSDNDNMAHDLIALLMYSCFSQIIDYSNPNNPIINTNFVQRLDSLWSGNTEQFSANEETFINVFYHYANEVQVTDATVDIARALDVLLARVVEVLDPKYIAINSLISASTQVERERKAVSLPDPGPLT